MSPNFAWKDVTKRLREAVAEPKRIFQANQIIDSENKMQGSAKLNKSLKKGRRL
jgi:hypothetical protein